MALIIIASFEVTTSWFHFYSIVDPGREGKKAMLLHCIHVGQPHLKTKQSRRDLEVPV